MGNNQLVKKLDIIPIAKN